MTRPERYWTNIGRRAVTLKMTLDATLKGLKPEAVLIREWITNGYELETKRQQRQGRRG